MQGVKGAREKTESINFKCTPAEKERIYSEARKRKVTVSQLLIGSALGVAVGNAIYDAIEGKEQ